MYDKYLREYSSSLFRLESFDKIPQKPGLYSWHLTSKSDTAQQYLEVFKQKYFKGFLKGHLRELYTGNLEADFESLEFKSAQDKFIKSATYLFCPPLYIGISEDSLRNRLKTHKRMLIKEINDDNFQNPNLEIKRDDLDTDTESKYFAKRLASILRKMRKDLSEKNLFVKIFYDLNKADIKDLKNVEYILNRIYNPIYGRR